mgnify:FL=1
MTIKFDWKKLVTAPNIMIVILVVLYLFDCYLPLPDGYTGYNGWVDDLSPTANYILGYCGGLLKTYMARVPGVPGGQAVYRHLTMMFMHGGLLHLIANCVGLYFIGNYAVKRYGKWLPIVLYFLIGFIEGFITDPLYAAMVSPEKAEFILSQMTCGASGGIFGLVGIGVAAIFFDIKSIKKIDKPTLIVSAIYGVLTTYVVSFGWTTVCHNVALVLGIAFGTAIILPFFLLKKGKFAPKPVSAAASLETAATDAEATTAPPTENDTTSAE